MKGDRIVFNQSNKELGLSNGDFGMLTASSSRKFTVKLDSGREVEFNPSEFNGFKHGYSSTVYKAQGASIKDVYVLHDGFATSKSSYVAMSRHIKDIRLYSNREATRSEPALIRQLGFDPELGASINFYSKEDLEALALKESKGLLSSIYDKVSSKLKSSIISLVDKASVDRDYYVFEKPEVSKAIVEEILEPVNEYSGGKVKEDIATESSVLELEEAAVVGGLNTKQAGNNIGVTQNKITGSFKNTPSTHNPIPGQQSKDVADHPVAAKQRMTPKERFYASRDYKLKQQAASAVNYEQEDLKLRQEIKFSAEKVAIDLLGEPNLRLSDGRSLRFGKSGSIAVRISGEKSGNWYDFKEGKGGDLFDLVQAIKGCDFKEAADYLRSTLGINNSNIIYLHNLNDKYIDHHKQIAAAKAEEAAALKKVESLYNRSKSISGNSVAAIYLKGRGISCKLSEDIRTAGIYTKEHGKTVTAIVAFVRSGNGKITGGQQILLDSTTYKKADVATPKKSFGKIGGSFVEVASHPSSNNKNDISNRITVIAEGLETALSIKQAGVEARIICSLGIGNIKNYVPQEGERIIIAADHDGENAVTAKTIIEASDILSRLVPVRVVKPKQIGDFNDILPRQGNSAGNREILNHFTPVIRAFTAKTLDEFLIYDDQHNESGRIKEDLAYIRQYNVNEDKILAGFKHSYLHGMQELSDVKAKVQYSERAYNNNTRVIEEIQIFDGTGNKQQIISELIDVPKGKNLVHLEAIRDKALNIYIKRECDLFNQAKEQSTDIQKLFEVIGKEQQFLANLAEKHTGAMINYATKDYKVFKASQTAYEKSHLLQKTGEIVMKAEQQGAMTEVQMMKVMRSTINIEDIYTAIDKVCEDHHIKTNLTAFSNAKATAATPSELLDIITKEQNFLSGLHGNLKYKEEQQNLLPIINAAQDFRQDNMMHFLRKAVEYSLDHQLKTGEEIVGTLQQTTSLRSTYIALDRSCVDHHIVLFRDTKTQATSLDALFEVISKEQEFLTDLHKDLKYHGHDENLLTTIATAHLNPEDNILSKLRELTKDIINSGIMSDAVIYERLQNSTDLKSTYIDLDKAARQHYVDTNLNIFKEERGQARTPEEVIKIIAKEQDFLGSLHGNLKYREIYPDELLERVKQAYDGKDSILRDLHQVTAHILQQQVMPESELLKRLQNTENAHATGVELTKTAQDHYSNIVIKNMNFIACREQLEIHGQKFDCPVKYLQYEVANPAHSYADIARFKRSIPRVQEQVRKMELAKEMSKDMGDMVM